LIARGSTVKPIFERVRFTDEETGEFQKELKLSRHQPMGLLNDESNLAAKKLKVTHKEYDELTANVILPNNQIHDISISNGESDMININSGLKNFENLNLSNNHKNNGNRINSDNNSLVEENRKIQKPQANSMQQVLVQALHSSDEHLLKEVLGQTNLEIINNTVKKLPTQFVVPFLESMIDKFQGNPNYGTNLLRWIKSVLIIHMAYLMTIPRLTSRLSNFYKTLDTRCSSFQKLLNFHGRLEILTQQISTRNLLTKKDDANKPKNVYVEAKYDP
ncbi:13330_t:CDS:2, partial [Entrophospora sp. SA101]